MQAVVTAAWITSCESPFKYGCVSGGDLNREEGSCHPCVFLRFEGEVQLLQREAVDMTVDSVPGVIGHLYEKPASRRHPMVAST